MEAKIKAMRMHQETLDAIRMEAEKIGLTVPSYIRMVMMQHLETLKNGNQ